MGVGELAVIGLIRHGVTDWNKAGRLQGTTDIPLNDEGRDQAERLGMRLAEESWDLLFSSHLSRALETARIISSLTGIPLSGVDPRIGERYFGRLEGTTEAERIARWGSDWRSLDHGSEPKPKLAERVFDALEQWNEEYPGKRILAVTHGAVIGVVLDTLFPELGFINLKNTGINIIEKRNGKWELVLHNCALHLVD